MIRIFIGFDRDEVVAYHVLCQSIIEHASEPVAITPVHLGHLGNVFTRERSPLESTEFSFSRFLVPYLSGYEGWSIFMDCDMLLRRDISELWRMRNDDYAVMCVQHDYVPKDKEKFLHHVQTKYQKKNWSSVMLFNNARCKALTPDYVNTASGLQLHQFKWLEDDSLIGSVNPHWNHLVGEYENDPEAANVHYTLGGPYFPEYADCEYADEWRDTFRRVISTAEGEMEID